jgi:hypothetical protein
MMYRSFTQTAALTLTLLSSLYLLICNFGSTPATIAAQASTYVGHNHSLAVSLCDQKADNLVGVFLLLCAFTFELLHRSNHTDSEKSCRKGIVAGVVFSVALMALCFPISHGLSKHFEREVKEILSTQS